MPQRAPASIDRLHSVSRAFHRQGADRAAGKFDGVALRAVGTECAR